MPKPCVRPQQLLDGHPGVSCPHGCCIDCWLHHQTGQDCKEAYVEGLTVDYLTVFFVYIFSLLPTKFQELGLIEVGQITKASTRLNLF